MGIDGEHIFPGHGLPDVDNAIITGCGQQAAIWRPTDAGDIGFLAEHGAQFTRGDIPDVDPFVSRAGSDHHPIRRPGDAEHSGFRPIQGDTGGTSRDIP